MFLRSVPLYYLYPSWNGVHKNPSRAERIMEKVRVYLKHPSWKTSCPVAATYLYGLLEQITAYGRIYPISIQELSAPCEDNNELRDLLLMTIERSKSIPFKTRLALSVRSDPAYWPRITITLNSWYWAAFRANIQYFLFFIAKRTRI